MNIGHPGQLKKSKSWGPIWPNFEVNGQDWQSCLAGSSETAPGIFIFSSVLDAEYSSYVKFIATYAPIFFGYIISVLANVLRAVTSGWTGWVIAHP